MNQEPKRMELKISGMTCGSCEKHVQAALTAIPGVHAVKADFSRGRVVLDCDPAILAPDRVAAAVSAALEGSGYALTGIAGSTDRVPVATVLVIAALMIAGFLLVNAQGWFNFLPEIDSSVGLGMLFVAGLLTSVHCVAMCGGIALSQQLPKESRPAAVPPVIAEARLAAADNSARERKNRRARTILRGLPYHLGRIVSYTLIGGLVGAIGSVFSFSPMGKGILAGLAGLFMVGMGLRMLGLFPRLTNFRIPGLSRIISPALHASISRRGPFFVGLLNGLMPCGPLQTMQLYALGTGSAAMGALSMLLFSAGTVPLLFGFGALSGFFSRHWQRRLVLASAVMVVFFGLVMGGRALELSGASGMLQTAMGRLTGSENQIPSIGGEEQTVGIASAAGGRSGSAGTEVQTMDVATPAGNTTTATIKDGVQYVSFDLQPNSYAPITIQKGIPVRWTVNATAATITGCNREIIVPQLNLRLKLKPGANVLEFTPPASAGTISYSCWMGMINSSIKVVDKLPAAGAGNGGTAKKISLPKAQTLGSSGLFDSAGTSCSMGCCGTETPSTQAGNQ